MDQNLDHANICPACGRLCGFHKRFCNSECRDQYLVDRGVIKFTPGETNVSNSNTAKF